MGERKGSFRASGLAHLIALCSLLLPWAALGLASLRRPPRHLLRVVRPWALVWLAPLALVAFVQLLQGQSLGQRLEALSLLGQGALACAAAAVLRVRSAALRRGLLAALAMLFIIGSAARLESRVSWHGYASGLAWISGVDSGEGLAVTTSVSGQANTAAAYRLWRVPAGNYDLVAAFDARLTDGRFGWTWQWDPNRVDEPYQLTRLEDASGAFTRVVNPTGPDPYLYRTFATGRPLSGQTFRASLELRSSEAEPPCGALYLAEEGGRHVGARDFCLTPSWQTLELVWQAPATATRTDLVLILNDLEGHSYDIGRVEAAAAEGGAWQALGLASPHGMAARLSLPGVNAQTLRTLPTGAWQRYQVVLPKLELETPGVARLELQLEDGSTVETRRVSLQTLPQARVYALAARQRQQLWFDHPNLLGHSVATAGLALLATSRSAWQGGLGATLALLVVALTGSRTALLGLLAGSAVTLIAAVPGRARSKLLVGGAFALAALIGFGLGGFDRTFAAEDRAVIERTEVWGLAWQAFLSRPWRGLEESFESYWKTSYRGESLEVLQHAHSLWLEFAANYGLPGLLAILWLTGGLLWLAWRWGGWRGLALVVPVLVMNVFDYTLFYSGVLYPLILGLNALSPRSGPSPVQRE